MENKKIGVWIGCESIGHYSFALVKYVNDLQKKHDSFSVKKSKSSTIVVPKNELKTFKSNCKVSYRWKISDSIYVARDLCRDKKFNIQLWQDHEAV